jgi:hypothetical protein
VRVPAPSGARTPHAAEADRCCYCGAEASDVIEIHLARGAGTGADGSGLKRVEIPVCGSCRLVHGPLWRYLVVSLFFVILAAALLVGTAVKPINDMLEAINGLLRERTGDKSFLCIWPVLLAVAAASSAILATALHALIERARKMKRKDAVLDHPDVKALREAGWRPVQ